MLPTRLGWFGAVAYALPILEVWLLTSLSERGASVFLVALQVVWVIALLGVLDRCLRGSPAYRRAVTQARAEEAAEQAETEADRVAEQAAVEAAAATRRAARPRRVRTADERRRSHR